MLWKWLNSKGNDELHDPTKDLIYIGQFRQALKNFEMYITI